MFLTSTKIYDITLVIDQSNAITLSEYREMLYITEQIYETFSISKTTRHLSLATAFHDTDVIYRFKESSEKQKAMDPELIRTSSAIRYPCYAIIIYY